MAHPCPVADCDRSFDKPQGLALHITRTHPGYDGAVTLGEEQSPTDTEVEFSVTFDPGEVVLLQAMCFLRGCGVQDLAAEAFNDLFAWARAQADVTTLVELRDAWTGALVENLDPGVETWTPSTAATVEATGADAA